MIQALPEILFYDEDAETQVYEDDKPDPIFKLNIIQKFANTKLARYASSFYRIAYKEIFTRFQAEFDYINNFILEEEEERTLFSPLYIIDDTEEEGEKTLEEEEEEEFSFLKLWKDTSIIRKIYSWIKKARKAWKMFKKAKKLISRWFGKAKNQFFKWKNKLQSARKLGERFIKEHLKPRWGEFKRNFNGWKRGFKRITRQGTNPVKRAMNFLKRKLKNQIGKRIMNFFKRRFAKEVVKRIFQQVLKWAGGLFTGTGVGAVIGVALIGAAVAWEVYDLTHDVEGKTEHDFSEENTKTEAEVKKREEQFVYPEPLYRQGITINHITQLEIDKHYKHIQDNVTLTLIKANSITHQIFARIYEFYKHCVDWLENQQDFVSTILETIPEGTNTYFDKLVKWTDTMEDKDAKRFLPTPKKDPKKVKQPKFTSMEKLMEVQKMIERGEKMSKIKLWWNDIKVNNKFGGNGGKDEQRLKSWTLMKHILEGKSFTTIDRINPRIKIARLDKELAKHNNLKKEKRGALGLKNHLLFELYCRLVWIKESMPA